MNGGLTDSHDIYGKEFDIIQKRCHASIFGTWNTMNVWRDTDVTLAENSDDGFFGEHISGSIIEDSQRIDFNNGVVYVKKGMFYTKLRNYFSISEFFVFSATLFFIQNLQKLRL